MSASTVLRTATTPKKALAAAAAAATAAGTLIAATPAQATWETSPSRSRAVAKKMIDERAQYRCFARIVDRESDWRVTATNASSGAYGLMQALPGSKMASAGRDWRTNPATQIKWGMRYMNNRYGSPCGAWKFWRANGWY
ncbi:aggregation-promoting factor C-terminal-like domain-containing protein [Streptomyces acidicola]|uniref:Lytic transglycosylase domain-containing protein n=1 Tax=Streptomyces acidicola TaxID=2596892 RepID=A0A5N8WTT9_9ACTN|nr:transglycosylase SLT domain-containing protein [Streptomyces acidicola]MPY49645.1 lytic transglycosylase domain-containing protein [Streptomyces acidicola]